MLRQGKVRLGSRRTWLAAIAMVAIAGWGCGSQPEVVGMVVSPFCFNSSWCYSGNSEDLRATAYYSDGSQEDVAKQASWHSSDETVATVSSGVVTRVGTGHVVISAEYGGQHASTDIEVP
jgi:hypothetical protein